MVVGMLALRLTAVIGSCMAMTWTFKPASPSTPAGVPIGGVGSGMAWAPLKGRSPSRSKMDPRSTKNGSLRWPAKKALPSARWATVGWASLVS